MKSRFCKSLWPWKHKLKDTNLCCRWKIALPLLSGWKVVLRIGRNWLRILETKLASKVCFLQMRFSANLNAASSSSLLSLLEFSTICSEGRQGYLFFQWGDSNSQGGYCTARLLQKTFHPSFLVLFLIMIIEVNKRHQRCW